MPYIDQVFYESEYRGIPIEPDAFLTLEVRASDLIDMLTSFKLLNVDLEQQPKIIKNNVKKAVAAQIEYMSSNGGELAIHGGSPSSVNIGNFSYSEGGSESFVSKATLEYLKATGLLYRGVSTYGY